MKWLFLSLSLFFGACAPTKTLVDTVYFHEQDVIANGGDLLSGPEVVGAISGNTLYGHYLISQTGEIEPEQQRWVEYLAPDGGLVYYDFQRVVEGRWGLSGDLACFSYSSTAYQNKDCFRVYLLGRRLYFVSVKEEAAGRVRAVVEGMKNGNVEGLVAR